MSKSELFAVDLAGSPCLAERVRGSPCCGVPLHSRVPTASGSPICPTVGAHPSSAGGQNPRCPFGLECVVRSVSVPLEHCSPHEAAERAKAGKHKFL